MGDGFNRFKFIAPSNPAYSWISENLRCCGLDVVVLDWYSEFGTLRVDVDSFETDLGIRLIGGGSVVIEVIEVVVEIGATPVPLEVVATVTSTIPLSAKAVGGGGGVISTFTSNGSPLTEGE